MLVAHCFVQDTSSHAKRAAPGLITSSNPPASPTPSTAAAATPGLAIALSRTDSRTTSQGSVEVCTAVPSKTLSGVRLVVQPGELLAVVGEVGAGKSSLLAALLGELMPMSGPDGRVHGEWGCCWWRWRLKNEHSPALSLGLGLGLSAQPLFTVWCMRGGALV